MEGSSGTLDLRQIWSLNSCQTLKIVKALHSLVEKDISELRDASKNCKFLLCATRAQLDYNGGRIFNTDFFILYQSLIESCI